MSILNINRTNETNQTIQIDDNKKPYNFATSSIIKGTITSKSNGITTVAIQSDNNKPTILKLNSNEIFGEKDDEVAFEVVSNSNEALTLRQVLDKSNQERLAKDNQEQANVLELYRKNNIIQDEDTKEARQEEQQLKQSLIELQRDIRFGKSVNTTSAINTLISSGLNVDQVPLQALTKAMTVPTSAPASTSQQPTTNQELILQQLEQTNLSQEKSLDRINSLLGSVQSILDSDQLDIVSILQSEEPITPATLFANTTQQPKQLDTTNLDDTLRQDITNFLGKINVEATEDNIRLAQIFIKNDIAITEANINNYQFLTNPTIDVTTFAQLSIQSLLNNDNLMELQLTDNTPIAYTNYNEVAESLKDVSDYTFTQIDIDNATIQSILKANADLAKSVDNSQSQQYNLTQQQATAKNNLAEIILKLTSEVMYNLNSKGINITTQHLKDALQSVNTAQQQINEQAIATSNAQLDETQKQLLHETISQSRTASLLNPTLLTATDTQPTLVSLLQATNKYNDNATTISAKHNDSIYKVTDQIPALLESLGLTPTRSYIKSAEALIRNNMDVTKENIDNVATTISKLELIQDKLQPSTVIKMLQDGINPLTTPIDELISYIDTYGDEYATNNGDNLAKYILQVQKDKETSEDTKKAIKAIYRALNIIDKNGVASVGMSLKNNYNLTLNNLLDSAKIYAKTKNKNTYLNETITDDTDLKVANENSIKNLINNATLTTQAVNIQKFIDSANYTALKQLMEEDANIYDEVLEVLNDKLETINNSTAQQQQQIEELQTIVSEVLEASPEVLSFLVANNLPITRNNIVSAQAFEKDKNAVTKIIDSIITNDYDDEKNNQNLKEALSDVPTMEDTNIFDNNNLEILTQALSTTPIDIDKLNLQQDALKILQLQNNLALNNNDYSATPIQLSNGEIANITMHIVTDDIESKTNLNLIFSLNTKNLGDINIAVNYDTTSDQVAVAIANDTDKLTNTQSLLQSIATALNIDPSNISITTSNITTV